MMKSISPLPCEFPIFAPLCYAKPQKNKNKSKSKNKKSDVVRYCQVKKYLKKKNQCQSRTEVFTIPLDIFDWYISGAGVSPARLIAHSNSEGADDVLNLTTVTEGL